MKPTHIEQTRIVQRRGGAYGNGDYVLYWMQQSQRADYNHALEFAVERANELSLPMLAVFALTPTFPDANRRHYQFMLEGLQETQRRLARRGIKLVVQQGDPAKVAAKFAMRAALLVCDRGYLRCQKQWRSNVCNTVRIPVVEVETDAVVPVDVASTKAEYAARTIRPKIQRQLSYFLTDLIPASLRHDSLNMTIEADPVDINAIDKVLELMGCASAAPAVPLYRGGADAAEKHLREFITGCLDGYSEHRNQPQTDFVSHMSKYLHFGQISPVSLALQVRDSQQGKQEDRDAFLEELLVRRELCLNYVHRTPNYDSYSALPEWALNALADHSGDPRPHLYAAQELENAQTDDPYWNAAMREMKFTGYMHNYMRMYWGKKILEWSKTPEEAFRLTLDLNNKYFIDGRDPISFASVAWIFGLHDRPWQTRPVFGSVRCMTAGGLERKTDPDAYVRKVNALVEKLEA